VSAPEAALPGAAERAPAYPGVLECDVTTLLGTTVHVRAITPDDAPRLARFHDGLSERSVYFRFFSPHAHLRPPELEWFTRVDYHDRLALIVEVDGELVAVGRYDHVAGTTRAEVAFVVADRWQHHGIATLLLDLLASAAYFCGIDTFVASVLSENREMLAVFLHSRFEVVVRSQSGVVEVEFPIAPKYDRPEPRLRVDGRRPTT
jgi:RimJ/RimL family protein N-acetyltransferase